MLLIGWPATCFHSLSSAPLCLCVTSCPIANARSPVEIGRARRHLALVDIELEPHHRAFADIEPAQFHPDLVDIGQVRYRPAVEAESFAGEAASAAWAADKAAS